MENGLMFRIALATMLVLLVICEANARPRLRRSSGSTSRVSFQGGPQEVATAKAQYSAQRHIKGRHVGGGYGGARAEGVAFSAHSAQQALNNCCYTGKRPVAGSAVVRGSDGWYAVKVYW